MQQAELFIFLQGKKEQYAHCAAGICVDRKAAGSEMRKKREREGARMTEDPFINHTASTAEQGDGPTRVRKPPIEAESRQV